MIRTGLAALAAVLMAASAHAEILVTFDEGAPVDRFTISNSGTCPLGPATITIDLTGSSGRLIFDVTAKGAGVSVYQPFRLVSGRDLVAALPSVDDGDEAVSLDLHHLDSTDQVAFTIDVDDRTGAGETIVSGSEIAGATVRLDQAGGQISARFGADAVARLPAPACTS